MAERVRGSFRVDEKGDVVQVERKPEPVKDAREPKLYTGLYL